MAARVRAVGHVGLFNQGATCYLNSLLQSLFFTPEFRSALLHRWQYNAVSHPKADKCIPYQLQLLFARLLASKRPAVETAALTRSFRWTDAESFRQHDIQELMRVLFAALDKTLNKTTAAAPPAAEHSTAPANGTAHVVESKTANSTPSSASPAASPSASPQLSPTPSSPLSPTNLSSSFPSFSPMSPSFVHQLYCGKLTDYLRCLSCHTARQRTDEFMDVSLDVEHCTSLEQAMHTFIQPETLTGDNRWRCDNCQTKVDAQKGLHFHTLPPVLTIQLKRFVFDFNLMQRTKLQHRVSFPQMIDMSAYMPAGGGGALIYDLFAVLMHSGTANGGHYYSYIRAFNDQFLEFNDTNVYTLPANAWEQAYGGGRGACAYMLIYRSRELEMESGGALAGGLGVGSEERLVSLEELEREVGMGGKGDEWRLMKERGGQEEDVEAAARQMRQREVELLPAELKAVVEAEDEAWLKVQQQHEEQRRRMEVTVLYAGNEHTFHFDQDTLMADCLTTVATHFALPASLSHTDDVRFRRYDRTHEWTAEPYPAHLTLSQCEFNKRNTVTLETKTPTTDWPPHNPHLIPIRLIRTTLANLSGIVQQSTPPSPADCHMLATDCTLPLHTFRQAVAELLGVGGAGGGKCVRLVRLLEDRGEVLEEDERSLKDYKVCVGDVLYVEEVDGGGEMDGSSGASTSPLCRLLDESKCQIKVLFNLPNPTVTSSSSAASLSSASSDLSDAPAYEQALHISKHATLRSLKFAISPLVELPTSAFRLSRNECSAHWKDEDATLSQLGLVDYSSVYVSEGRQCGKEEFNLRCYLLQPNSCVPNRSSTSTNTSSSSSSSFLFLFDLPTSTTLTIGQLKLHLLTHLNNQHGDVHGGGNGFGILHFRLRDKKGSVSSRLYEEGRVVGEVLVDEGEIVVERCESEEAARVVKECVLVRWCWWDGRQLSSEHELMVRKMVMVGTLREEMRAAWRREKQGNGSSKVAEEQKQVSAMDEEKQHPTDAADPCPPIWLARGMARVRMRKTDVDKVAWLSETELADNKLAKNNPLRLAAGDLIIATIISPHSRYHQKHTTTTTAAAVPEAPTLSAPPAPPMAPPIAPAIGAAGAVVAAAPAQR